MLKRSYYLTALITASTTLAAVLARSQPFVPISPIAPQTTGEQRVSPSMPVCYIQLENGQLRDLRSLCGKKATSPAPSRGVQRLLSQPDPDSEDDDDSVPMVPPRPSTTPSQTPPPQTPSNTPASQAAPTKPVPQIITSPAAGTSDRPTTILSPPASPAISAPSTPHPLAIEEVKPSRD